MGTLPRFPASATATSPDPEPQDSEKTQEALAQPAQQSNEPEATTLGRAAPSADSAESTSWSDSELRAAAEAYLATSQADAGTQSIDEADIARRLLEGPLSGLSECSVADLLKTVSAVFAEDSEPLGEESRQADRVETVVAERTRDALEAVRVGPASPDEIALHLHALEQEGLFDPSTVVDARRIAVRAIAIRQGQGVFRKALLEAYGRKCAVTDCDAEEALEAAHIIRYQGERTNIVPNGLLLRADIHTLFDRGLLTIDAGEAGGRYTVRLAPSLASTAYNIYDGKPLWTPTEADQEPCRKALNRHRQAAVRAQKAPGRSEPSK
ncbi:MAG: HNH endonuclease [Planctomycetes bacterium]|nr:HNH endonuclease [Planctomycetota bacterium]